MSENLLPVWAQPHSFLLVDEGPREVFTFPLVLTELRSLSRIERVRSFGRRLGFEWLPGLSRGVQRETRRKLPRSELETFLKKQHGIAEPGTLGLDRSGDGGGTAGEPGDDILRAFAQRHGAQISRWAANAFTVVAANLAEWAQAQERIPLGLGPAAQKRLTLTVMSHALCTVSAIDGSEHWARQYETLYERAALELEDLALRRPTPDICPLCERVYIPMRPTQAICGNQIWDARSRELIRLCVDESTTRMRTSGDAADYRRRRKTRWAAMNRVREKYGERDPRTRHAVAEWKTWRTENLPPRRAGRPRSAEPPYQPAAG